MIRKNNPQQLFDVLVVVFTVSTVPIAHGFNPFTWDFSPAPPTYRGLSAITDDIVPVLATSDSVLDDNANVPKDFKLTKDLVVSHGYHYQNYTVVTADGYILKLHRILAKWVNAENPGFPVLLMHGLIVSSESWLQKENYSLPFILANQGYDVWLADQRGNCYSKGHVQFNVTDPRFWNFSFHESGIHDMPAIIDSVLAKNGGTKLFYIGHSMGTTVFFTMTSMMPEYNAKIKAAILLAPVAIMPSVSELQSLALKFAVIAADAIFETLHKTQKYEIVPRKKGTIETIRKLCSEDSLTQGLCLDMFGMVLGENLQNMNKSTIGEQLSHLVAGSSINTVHHLSQLFKSGFCFYDRGGSDSPPCYPLEKVTAPIAMFYSFNDVFINQRSVEAIRRALYYPLFAYALEDPKFTHLDYLTGINAKYLVYDRIIATFSSLLYHWGSD